MSIRSRLDRLESEIPDGRATFWDLLAGDCEPEVLDAAGRAMLEAYLATEVPTRCPVEERIAEIESLVTRNGEPHHD